MKADPNDPNYNEEELSKIEITDLEFTPNNEILDWQESSFKVIGYPNNVYDGYKGYIVDNPGFLYQDIGATDLVK